MDPMKRSIADAQNYGDDVPAQDLINPPAFADLSIEPMVMTQYRGKAQLLSLFAKIGMEFSAEVGDAIFQEASRGYDEATINDFRNAAVMYTDAVQTGKEAKWRMERGL